MKKFLFVAIMSLFVTVTLHVINEVSRYPQYANPWEWTTWFVLDYRSILLLWMGSIIWLTVYWERLFHYMTTLDLDEHPSIIARHNRNQYYSALGHGYLNLFRIGLHMFVALFVAAVLVGISQTLFLIFQYAALALALRLVGVAPIDTNLLAIKPEFHYLKECK